MTAMASMTRRDSVIRNVVIRTVVIRTVGSSLAIWFAALMFALPASSQTAGGEPVAIELADVSARLEVTIYWGRLEVRAHSEARVVVESRPIEGQGDRERTVLRPPNDGFVISESDNVVRVVADSPETSGRRSLDLLVHVPRRVDLSLTMDRGGEIVVFGVEGGIEVSTNNGSVELHEVSGWASVDALNGSIVAGFEAVEANRSMSFGTLNGEIDLTLPPDVDMDVRMQVQDDEIVSELELVNKRWRDAEVTPAGQRAEPARSRSGSPRRLEAQLGGGGPLLFLSTHNGPIVLRSGTLRSGEDDK